MTRQAGLLSGIILITVPTIQYGGYFRRRIFFFYAAADGRSTQRGSLSDLCRSHHSRSSSAHFSDWFD
jgi:hypothetical protein